MQPNTQNTHHDTDPTVPPELLEALARALAAALIPPPRAPTPAEQEEPADFLTAAQLARRLGVSRETVRRLAIAGALPHTVVCQGARKTTRRYPAAVRRGVRGQRPGGRRPGRLRRRLAGAGHRARTVTARPPRHRTLPGPARFAARWRELAACRGADLRSVLPRARRIGRGRAAGLRGVPGPRAVPGLRHHQPDHPRHLGRPIRTGTPRAAVPLAACHPAGA